ncbi:MAG TPA: prolyl oligopeptidase family serine peptidase [Steroidobacteraceae bacterium]|nr:prolyl oligopeptidase family serine peptidase [Steroidobacteraceae bacterium]
MRSSKLLAVSVLVVSSLRCGVEPVPFAPTTPVASATASAAASDAGPAGGSGFAYPPTPARDIAETLHGVTVHDRFRWLEDEHDEKVKAWTKAEDAFTRERLGKLPARDAIKQRLTELFYVDSQGAPSKAKNRYFWSHRDAKQEKSVVFWREGKTGAAKVLLDPNGWSADGSVALGSWEESQDGKYIAYGKKEHNSDEATLYVMEVATGKVSNVDVIPGAKYASPSWTPKGDGFYYTWLPEVDGKTVTVADRPGRAEVRFHKLGEDPKKDRVVRACTNDPKTFIGATLSRDGHFLLLYVEHGWTSADVYYKDLRGGREPKDFTPLVVGQPYKYDVTAFRDRFYVETDDGAPNRHVMRVDPAKPDRASWQEIVPERKDATIDQMSLVGGKLAIAYLKDVVSHLEIHDLDGKLVREIALPTKGAASTLTGQSDEDEAYYTFTSFTYPTEIYETSVSKGGSKLYFKLNVPVDPSKYSVEQEFATSKDGTRVPFFIVAPKTFDKGKGAPTLVYGYGGFLGTQKPRFTSSAYPWLERGGVYIVANLRGGGEYGEKWHQAGMRRSKQNVFDDLKAVLEQVIHEGISSPDRIAVRGASNGGLLVAAAVTQVPELFRVGLCGVPLVDMLRYHLFGSGKTWMEEYGSADDAEDFRAIHAYSPYQHVTHGTKYPAVLLLSADSDDRVDPMHARKFAAELQADSSGGIVLLRIEKNAGHGGADLVKSLVESVTDELTFAWSEIASAAPSSEADGGLAR